MKYRLEAVPEMTFDDFVEREGLEIVVRERGSPILKSLRGLNGGKLIERYYASAVGVEVAEGGCLISRAGNGNTPEEAIDDYAKWLSEKTIIIDAFLDKRRNIVCPRFVKAAT